MIPITWAALLLLTPSCRAQDWRYRRDYRNERRNEPRVYSRPPYLYYQQERRWREYKAEHDAATAREEQLGMMMNMQTQPPAAPAPYAPAVSGSTLPSHAEIREFKDTYAATVKAFIAEHAREAKGAFEVQDGVDGAVLRLKLKRLRVDGLRYPTPATASGCADFETVDAPKKAVDLDFELTKDGGWSVSAVYIHMIDGRTRYGYDSEDRRVPAPAEAAKDGPAR